MDRNKFPRALHKRKPNSRISSYQGLYVFRLEKKHIKHHVIRESMAFLWFLIGKAILENERDQHESSL